MQAGQPEDVSVVLSNFDALATLINGNLDQTNLNAASTPTFATLSLSGNTHTTLALTGAAAGLTIGGDTNLYRSAAGDLKTDGRFLAVGNIAIKSGLAAQ